jgi:hypothetical protein
VYRPPNRPPKRAWARHLHEVRRERKLSQTQAFELVYEGLGLSPKSRAVYVAIDMGDRQPTAREAEYLASVFGWPPDIEEAEPPATDQAALIAALDRQSAAMEALVAMMAPVVLGQEHRLEKVEAVLESLVQGAMQDGDARPAHEAGTAK